MFTDGTLSMLLNGKLSCAPSLSRTFTTTVVGLDVAAGVRTTVESPSTFATDSDFGGVDSTELA
jgi:hypothetical protein